MYTVGKILLFAICFKRDPKFLHRDSGIRCKVFGNRYLTVIQPIASGKNVPVTPDTGKHVPLQPITDLCIRHH